MRHPRQRTLKEKMASALHILECRKNGLNDGTEKGFYRKGEIARESFLEDAEQLLHALTEVGVKLEVTNNFPMDKTLDGLQQSINQMSEEEIDDAINADSGLTDQAIELERMEMLIKRKLENKDGT